MERYQEKKNQLLKENVLNTLANGLERIGRIRLD